jgi:surface antigen
MNDQQIQELAKRLNVDPTTLSLIYGQLKPRSETELLQMFNTLNAMRSDGVSIEQGIAQLQSKQPNTTNIQPQAVNFDELVQQGYQFRPANPNDLLGQCAWFAEQITRLPDGRNWTIGNSLQEKVANLNRHKAEGNAFLRGEAQPEVGNSIIINSGTKYGHVAVISEILPDGRLRLTESNWGNDLRVSHDRIIDQNDADIVGFLKTKPTQEFKTTQPKTNPQTPTTPKVRQQPYQAPQDRQELPVERQTVKVDDIKANNPNAQQLEKNTGYTPEQLTQAVQNQPVVSDVEQQVQAIRPSAGPTPTPIQPNPTQQPIQQKSLINTFSDTVGNAVDNAGKVVADVVKNVSPIIKPPQLPKPTALFKPPSQPQLNPPTKTPVVAKPMTPKISLPNPVKAMPKTPNILSMPSTPSLPSVPSMPDINKFKNPVQQFINYFRR